MSKTDKLGQAGMVSILVTLIMMIVISLIVIGFGEVARSNQRETLDRQLASQAYYAAETGVNDVLNAYSSPNFKPATDNSCDGGGSVIQLNSLNPVLHETNGVPDVAYTCLTLTDKVNPITIDNLTLNTSQSLPLDMSGPSDITFNWANTSSGNSPASCPTSGDSTTGSPSFVVTGDWTANCNFGVLRVDLFDVTANGTGDTDPNDMASNTASLYLVPSDAPTSMTNNLNFSGGTVIKAHCTDTTCSATLTTNANALGTDTDFDTRISSIYEAPPSVSITATTAGVTFSNAQLEVDSTGRAQDELKRIQVRVALSGNSQTMPNDALASTNTICKRFYTLGDSGSTAMPDQAANPPLCDETAVNAPDNIVGGGGGGGDSPGAVITPVSGKGNGGPSYWARFMNGSTELNPADIVGCVWNWDDGTTETDACLPGEETPGHKYPSATPNCTWPYTVTLTIYLNDGSSVTTTHGPFLMPWPHVDMPACTSEP